MSKSMRQTLGSQSVVSMNRTGLNGPIANYSASRLLCDLSEIHGLCTLSAL